MKELNPGAPRKNWIADFFINLAALAAGALLFAASFPNLLFPNGLAPLGWAAYIPVFWLIRRVSLPGSIFWGALYGYAAYGLFNYWLSVFHPLAGLIVDSIYLVYMAVLFPLLKLAALLFPRRGYLVQWLLWLGYEYLRTLGFLGYSYGIAGYSQWQVLPLIQIAGIFGVSGVSALILFPQTYLAQALPGIGGTAKDFFRREKITPLVWAGALVFTLLYGFNSQLDYSAAPRKKLALIQLNTDPWKGGVEAYRENFRVLKRLSEEALAAAPDTDLVVWSETAFVPRIYWHLTYRDEPEFYPLVRDLMDFLALQKVPYVIGNDDARKEVNVLGYWDQVDYNAVMLFEGETMRQLYRKIKLVPFTEHFPYEKQFPWVYNALIAADTHFWKSGTEATVFEEGGLKFSTPICFEDTFGWISRDFVRNGAELIVNLSNDAWSRSLPCQMQHLSMAVFRAVENRRAMVRSTASGQTCAIDPNGKVFAMAEPFTEAYLNVQVPVVDSRTLYTLWGDVAGRFFAAAAAAALLFGCVSGILGVIKKGRNV